MNFKDTGCYINMETSFSPFLEMINVDFLIHLDLDQCFLL